MIHETQQEQEQKHKSTYIFCSMINNSIFLLLLLLLFLLYNFFATTKLDMRNAKSSATSGQLDICSQMYPGQMSDEKSSSL